MEPASAIGLIGSVVGIADVLAKSIRNLLDLQSRYRSADIKVSTLIGQLSVLKAALGHIADMMNESMTGAQYNQFFGDLGVSLQACEATIIALDARLASLDRNDANGLTAQAKLNLIWDDSTMNEYLDILNNQIQALHLLLSALQCRSMLEQSTLLQEGSSRRLFNQVKDDTSSLLWFRDADSLASHQTSSTQDLSNVNTKFDFDNEILTSKVYRNMIDSNMTTAIQIGRRQAHNGHNSRPPSVSSQFRLSRTFSIHSERLPDVEDASSATLPAEPPQDRRLSLTDASLPSLGSVNIFSWQEETAVRDAFGSNPSSTEDNSIFRFQRRRHLVPSSTQLSLAPKQAPGSSINVLILGSFQSGKSTVIKSLMASFGCYDLNTRHSHRSIVHTHLAEILNIMGMETKDSDLNTEKFFDSLLAIANSHKDVSTASKDPATILNHQHDAGNYDLTTEMYAFIAPQWDKALACSTKEASDALKHSVYLNNSSVDYFIDVLLRSLQKGFIPTTSDILRCYVKTTGISVSHFEADGQSYNFFDVGGAPSEQRKWPNVITRKDALVYTFDVACYGQPSEGIPGQDAMREQFILWKSLINDRGLSDTRLIVVVFTKTDLLTERYITRLSAMEDIPQFEPEADNTDLAIQALAVKLMNLSTKDSMAGDEKVRRKITFWKTNIAGSVAEPAEVVLTALQQVKKDALS